MIFGECPYCEQPVVNHLARDRPLPCFEKVECESCKKWYWLKHSRVDPEAWTDEEFRKLYEINEETKAIKPRPPRPC